MELRFCADRQGRNGSHTFCHLEDRTISRSHFIRFANRALLAAGFALVANTADVHAKPQSQVSPGSSVDRPSQRLVVDKTKLPDLTVKIKKVTCFKGKVAVKVRLQNLQNGNVGITIPFDTRVTVGNLTEIIPSGASPQNPWYNGQEKNATLAPGYGTFKVSAEIDYMNLVADANSANDGAPSAGNSFDSNPDPLLVTCLHPAAPRPGPGSQHNQKREISPNLQKRSRPEAAPR